MDTAQIKAYAPQARKDFINAVTQRAARFGIHGDDNFDPVEFKGDTAIIGSQVFTKKGGELRERLVAKVKQTGFEMFIRSSAYTWFNRFVAIRYMELHDFLDHGFRVLSNPNGSDIPEVLEHATEVDLPGLDREKVLELRLAGDKDNELYRTLVIAQCNALHKAMPFLFDKIDNEAELLLPDNLLHTNSPIKRMVSQIDETLWDDVEIIGWIYQFYISEKKDEVIGKVVKSEDIPAATQLFTPNWIVKYMVQNTLGRMWMATYPESSLKSKMEYYIEPAAQEPDVQAEIDATTPKELNPEELTFLDPACGSGHILVEAYDILKEIYLERGYRTRDIPRLILSKNIYGLDIDDRAAQLACFAVLMRARMDDRRLFSRDDLNLNVMSIVETKGNDKDKLFDAVSKKEGGKGIWGWINQLFELFEQANTLGSLIIVPEKLTDKLNEIKSFIEADGFKNKDLLNYIADSELQNLKPIINQTQFLAKRYDCVVTNPPYMGSNYFNTALKKHVAKDFQQGKADLCSSFMLRNSLFCKNERYIGMITIPNWMFLSSFERLRKDLLLTQTIDSFIHNGRGVWGSDFGSCAFVIKNCCISNFKGTFKKLFDKQGSVVHLDTLRKNYFENRDFHTSSIDFLKIPGMPISYWASNEIRKAYVKNPSLEEISKPKVGMRTGNNDQFLRFWPEISFEKFNSNSRNALEALRSNSKWFPFIKGGEYRKWYGNLTYLVNWENDGYEIKSETLKKYPQLSWDNLGWKISNESFYFKKAITWTAVSSSKFGVRFVDQGCIFGTGGSCIFPDEKYFFYLGALLCSKLAKYIIDINNPSLNINVEDIAAIPVKIESSKNINEVAFRCYNIAKKDWNDHEIAWDFKSLPIISNTPLHNLMKDSYRTLLNQWETVVKDMQSLEEQINTVFIEDYELQNELKPEPPISEITLICNPYFRYGKGKTEKEHANLLLTDTIKELISYFLGCTMGRYSLDQPGLIYAHSGNIDVDPTKYKTFPADDDGIIPIMDMDWFEDDATKRFIEFLKTAWPEEYLDENLKFVADSLTPKTNESPENTIRRYLSTTFFKDHMKMYKKRPIYWLFSSGKQKAFECLVYLHRYNESTLSRMRSNYVTPLQGNISARIEFLDHEKNSATTPSAQKKIQKQIDVLKKKQVELKNFDDELRHYADMKISLDLDDGVKVNYGKFGNLLAEKKAITGNSDV